MNELKLEDIVSPLLRWYGSAARVLPWRDMPTPYRVWVSEIMLQQTRVDTALPYFERFTQALPDIAALAAAGEEQLLKLWEGLGYYSRVKNMQKAARAVMEQYGGELPGSFEALKALPGIGAYSAGAIASIAFGKRHPAVDGNVLRVISRITASSEDITDAAVKKRIEQQVTEILPDERVGDFNQSLMELGATVCLPNGAPRCETCPLNELCRGYAAGIAAQLPVKAAKAAKKSADKTVLVIVYKDRLALKRREKTGLLAGLWELPNADGKLSCEECTVLLNEWGIPFTEITPLPAAKHIFTHIEWRMTGFLVKAYESTGAEGITWASPEQLREQMALPTAFKAYRRQYDTYLADYRP